MYKINGHMEKLNLLRNKFNNDIACLIFDYYETFNEKYVFNDMMFMLYQATRLKMDIYEFIVKNFDINNPTFIIKDKWIVEFEECLHYGFNEADKYIDQVLDELKRKPFYETYTQCKYLTENISIRTNKTNKFYII